jgi:hypothetical protein
MKPKTKITAENIIALLRQRHAEDVFVPECKNGPTQSVGRGELLKLDAWVMVKSWAHWATLGYEVKVSRSDFEQDQKWIKYLDYCHAFSFVCPGGLIRAADLPKGVGLIWVSQNGESLHSKVKPEYHEPDPVKLQNLMIYVLMARVKADVEEVKQTENARLRMMREWVEQSEAKKELAHFVKDQIHKRLRDADERCDDIESKAKAVEEFRQQLSKLGINWDTSADDWRRTWEIRTEIEKLVGAVDHWTLRRIENAGKAMIDAVKTIEEFRKQVDAAEDPTAAVGD